MNQNLARIFYPYKTNKDNIKLINIYNKGKIYPLHFHHFFPQVHLRGLIYLIFGSSPI